MELHTDAAEAHGFSTPAKEARLYEAIVCFLNRYMGAPPTLPNVSPRISPSSAMGGCFLWCSEMIKCSEKDTKIEIGIDMGRQNSYYHLDFRVSL